MADNPFAKYLPAATPPSAPGVIYGRPKAPAIPSGYETNPAGGVRPIKGGPADPNANLVGTPGDTTKTGEDYLKTLPLGLAGQVRALSEGRRAFPTGTALKDPKVQELIAAATQFDPALDASNAATRVATRKDFTSGATSKNITSINTALGHLGTLKDAADNLHNRAFPLWNTVANAAETASGDSRVKTFNIARDAVANELMRVFRGTGGSLAEIEEWKNNIESSDSPEQLQGEISKAVDLLNSRLEAVGDQYSRGMGRSADPMSFLTPHARAVYERLSGGTDKPAPASNIIRYDANGNRLK